MLQHDTISQALATMCVVAAALVWTSGDDVDHGAAKAGVRERPQKPVAATIERASDSTTANLPPKTITDYAEIIDRPLFSSNRRPAVDTAPASAIEPRPELRPDRAVSNPLYRLVGVMLYANTRTALIMNSDGRTTFTLDVGESVDGWTLSDLTNESATLTRGVRTETINLERKSDPRLVARLQAQVRQRARAQTQERDRPQPTEGSDDVDNNNEETPNDEEND